MTRAPAGPSDPCIGRVDHGSLAVGGSIRSRIHMTDGGMLFSIRRGVPLRRPCLPNRSPCPRTACLRRVMVAVRRTPTRCPRISSVSVDCEISSMPKSRAGDFAGWRSAHFSDPDGRSHDDVTYRVIPHRIRDRRRSRPCRLAASRVGPRPGRPGSGYNRAAASGPTLPRGRRVSTARIGSYWAVTRRRCPVLCFVAPLLLRPTSWAGPWIGGLRPRPCAPGPTPGCARAWPPWALTDRWLPPPLAVLLLLWRWPAGSGLATWPVWHLGTARNGGSRPWPSWAWLLESLVLAVALVA